MVEAQAEEERQGVVELGFIFQDAEFAAEDGPENKPVERQHRQRIDQGPDDAELATLMADVDFSQGKLPDQFAMPPERGADVPWTQHGRERFDYGGGHALVLTPRLPAL